MKAPGFRALILKLLYHLSQEDKLKATFTYTECIPLVYQLIIHCPEPIVGKELVALAINLTTKPSNAEIMAANGQHEQLIERAFEFKDTLLFKVCRNIAQFYPKSLDILEANMDRYIELAQVSNEHTDLLLELLGTMVYIPSDLWVDKIKKFDFIAFIHNHLVNQYAEDDILLECVMLVGTICRNDDVAQIIASSYLIKLL